MAQELSSAAICLHRNGFDGAQAALTYLSHPTDAENCALRQGLFFLENGKDDSSLLAFSGQISGAALMAAVICQTDEPVQLETPGWTATVAAGRILAPKPKFPTKTVSVKIQKQAGKADQSTNICTRAHVSENCLSTLTHLAAASYVPASEESRERGAGGAD